MSEVVEFYRQQAANSQASINWLAKLQQDAMEKLVRNGFPSRRDENWKYSSTEQWRSQRFNDLTSLPEQPIKQSEIPISTNYVIDCVNGDFSLHQLEQLNFPSGVICLPIRVAAEKHPELVSRFLGKILTDEHGFHFLNSAYLKSGIFLYIPEQIEIESTIVIRHLNTKMGQNIQLRHLVEMSYGAKANLVEYYLGAEQVDYFANCITEINLEKSAQLVHYKIQCESRTAYHVGHIAVRQMANSHYQNHSLSLGGAWVRSDLTINLDEAKSNCSMNGIYAPIQGQHVDHHTTVYHHVPDCQSNQDYKGILQGNSRGVFNGRVVVSEGAMKTEAQQQNKNLLLSPSAEIDTKPQLEIYADDVICSHGATVGQLDEEALFYLATRGIDKEEASRYLIHAFASDNLAWVPHTELRDWMTGLLNQQLG